MTSPYVKHEAIVRWLEHELTRAEQKARDLAEGIGRFDQEVKLIRRPPAPPGGCGVIRVTVLHCVADAVQVGATVTVKDDTDTTIGTAVTGASGIVSIPIAEAGTYTVYASKSGETTAVVTVVATCTTNNVTVRFGRVLAFTVRGCNVLPVEGATVEATLGANTYTGTTDSAGLLNLAVQDPGTYSWSVSKSRLNTATGTRVATTCGSFAVNPDLTPATGYRCLDWGTSGGGYLFKCAIPLPETIHLNDSIIGDFVLTWSNGIGPSGGWIQTRDYDYPGCLGCPARTLPVTYTVHAVGFGGVGVFFEWSQETFAPVCPKAPGPGVGNQNTNFPCPDGNLTCPPSFVAICQRGAAPSGSLWCGGNPVITITE